MQAEYEIIDTQVSMDLFLARTSKFSDAILREAAVVCRSYVTQEGNLVYAGSSDYAESITSSDIRLIIQSQDPSSPCIEVVLESVDQMNVMFSRGIEDAIGIVSRHASSTRDRIALFFGRAPKELIPEDLVPAGYEGIVARSMRYRILGRAALGRDLIGTMPVNSILRD